MPTADMTVETKLSPDEVRAALVDFTERRPEIWPSVTPSLYEVYSVGETEAEIKEGTKLPFGNFWARERYDWSDPNTIRWTTVESNFCKPGSHMTATLEPRGDGGTLVRLHWDRTGSGVRGTLVCRMVGMQKGKPIADSIDLGLRGLEGQSVKPA